jgi:hypothetical protein
MPRAASDLCFGETGMNRSSSNRNDENQKRHYNFHESSPDQGTSRARRGSLCVFEKYQSLIRRGGAPPGAAAHIIIGGMGVSTPIILSERFDFHRILFGYLTLRRLRPAAGARRFVIVLHYQFFLKKNRTFQYTSERGIACAPAPTRAGLAHRG